MSIRLLARGPARARNNARSAGESVAHEIVGNRFFRRPSASTIPGVNDELSLPTVASFKTGDDPSFRQRDISGEFSKRITEAFAVSFGSTYSTSVRPADRPAWERTDFRIWKPRSNTGSSRIPNMSL